MAATNPKGLAYFFKLFNQYGGSTPRPERNVQQEADIEILEPSSRVEATENVVEAEAGPSKKARK